MKRRSTKRLAALAAAGLAGAGLVGCSAPHGTSSTGGNKTGTLIWYVNKTATLTPAVYQKVADGFTRTHPGVKVRIINQGGQGTGPYFQTLISSGNSPDVGTGIAITPQNAKDFVNLAGQAWARQAAAKNPLIRDYEINKGIYSTPAGYQIQDLIFYNKKLFAKAHIAAVPTTYSALTSDMAKLAKLGVTPMADSGSFIAGSQVMAMALSTIYQHNLLWEKDKSAGRVSFAHGPWQQAMQIYRQWIQKGYIDKGAVALQYNTVDNDFLQGKYGMYLVASWFTGNIAQTPPPFPVGVFSVPTLDGKTPAPQAVVAAFNWEIPTAAKHRTLAEEFVHYLSTNQKQAIAPLVKADGDFTQKPLYHLDSVGQAIQKIASQTKVEGVPGGGENVEPNGFATYMDQVVQGLWGGKSAAEVAHELDTWWNSNKGSSS